MISTLEINDNLLSISRRLDWRFVFANPSLQHVVVAGQPDDDLLNALMALSDHVSIWQGQSVESCSMLVMQNPSSSLCRRALETIKPVQFYFEFGSHSLNFRIRHVFDRALCIAAARNSGYTAIRSYWHWPDIANANRIIPLSQSEALSFVLAKDRSDFKTSLKMAGLNSLRQTGLLVLIIKSLGIAGERAV
jgi:hypothetical protein